VGKGLAKATEEVSMEQSAAPQEPAPRRGVSPFSPSAAREDHVPGGIFWGLLRIAIGWIFLWAFLDKLLALGFATGRDERTGNIDFFSPDAWINGGSPTSGFLEFGLHTKEPFKSWYADLAGQGWVDWIYMISMAAIGILLILGLATRLAAIGGIIWMLLFYTASAIWPENNPFLDDHIINAIALAGIAYVSAGRFLGLGRWWRNTGLVARYPILE
jgi:thiosulfate dehydrogenase [quinone] large subunit